MEHNRVDLILSLIRTTLEQTAHDSELAAKLAAGIVKSVLDSTPKIAPVPPVVRRQKRHKTVEEDEKLRTFFEETPYLLTLKALRANEWFYDTYQRFIDELVSQRNADVHSREVFYQLVDAFLNNPTDVVLSKGAVPRNGYNKNICVLCGKNNEKCKSTIAYRAVDYGLGYACDNVAQLIFTFYAELIKRQPTSHKLLEKMSEDIAKAANKELELIYFVEVSHGDFVYV